MIVDVQQGTPEWLRARVGFATASEFSSVLAKGRGGEPSKMRRNYMVQLVTERLTGVPVETYFNRHMEWGQKWEPVARGELEAELGVIATQVGFVTHDEVPWAGASPDSLIEQDCGAEIKCPSVSTNHVAVFSHGMPPEHFAQVQGNMWVTGRPTWWFASFDPRMPKNLRLYITLVKRDDAFISTLEAEVKKFLHDVEVEQGRLLRL